MTIEMEDDITSQYCHGNDSCFAAGDDAWNEDVTMNAEPIGADGPSEKKKRRQGPFEKLGLSPFVTRAVNRLGFNLPTPIQRKAIPAILSGRDVVAMARTGSGKTAAFVLPLVERLVAHKTIVGIRALILEPTRELAFQVEKVARQLCRFTDLRLCAIVGGCGMERQFEQLARNPDCVVACPGRLLHHVIEAEISLSGVEYLVIDEADQMFELGLAEQVEQLLQRTSPNRQCVLTSATLPSQMVEFSSAGLRSPEFIRLDVESSLSPTLDMWFLFTRGQEKLASFLYLLREVLLAPNFPAKLQESSSTEISRPIPPRLPQGVLVFTASRHHVEFLGTLLQRAGIDVAVAYGSMDLQARVESVARFRRGGAKVLIVTDVAARGLDIPIVGAVVNYDFPVSPKHFVHRVGRTARADRPGLGVSFVTRDELAYAVEVLLFAGIAAFEAPQNPAVSALPETPSDKQGFPEENYQFSESNQKLKKSVIGGMPDISDDIEFVREVLETDAELQSLYRTMNNAGLQYLKGRRPASRQSIKQAKRLLDGDASTLLNSLHPSLAERLPFAKRNHHSNHGDYAAFLQNLHSVKPKTTSQSKKGGRQGGVLSSSVVNRMETASFVRNLTNFSVQKSSQCDALEQEDSGLLNSGYNSDGNMVNPVVKQADEPSTVKRRPPISAAERRLMRKTKQRPTAGVQAPLTANGHQERSVTSANPPIDVFDWQSRAINAASSHFFLSVEKSASESQTSFREDQLRIGPSRPTLTSEGNALQAMAAAQLDLAPEDAQQQRQKVQLVRKWNAQRKRYMMTPVDAVSGKVLRTKQVKKRNEAGVLCRGELSKTGIYKKWVRSAGCVIQRIGEMERPDSQPNQKSRRNYSSNNSDDDATSEALPPLSSLTKDKGLVEAIESGAKLTRKQERKRKRLVAAQLGTTHTLTGTKRVKNEIRNVQQLEKVKKDALKAKARQDLRTRTLLRKTNKEKHMEKRRQQNEARAAPRRSFVLVRQPSRQRR